MEDVLVETMPRPDTVKATGIEQLYRADGDRIWRAVFAYAGDREVASDAVAEAFAQAIRRGRAIKDPQKWVWRAAFRIAAGDLSKRRRRPPGEVAQSYEMETSHEPNLIAALSKLPAKQRSSLVLHHYAGYSAAEVAAMIGSTSAAVRVHLHRGRARMRELLEASDD
jgi:RNA polymerase sigma factor (sigma-70 family)